MKPTRFKLLIISLVLFCAGSRAQTFNYIPDSTFSGDGRLAYTMFNNIDRLFGATSLPDGRFLVSGLSRNPSTNFFELCIMRFRPDGAADSSFGLNGIAKISMGAQGSIGGLTPMIKTTADGKVVAVNSGVAPGGNSQDMMVCRLDSNGVLDPSFNGSGRLFVDMTGSGTQPDGAMAFDFDASGNIWALGVCRTGGTPLDNDFALIKVTPAGLLDPSFDQDGKKLFNPSGVGDFGTGIKVQPDGKIVFGGNTGGNNRILRIDSTGTLDPAFGSAGVVTLAPAGGASITALDIDSQGRIVVAGISFSNNVVAVRLNPNGTPNTGFGTNGTVVTTAGSGANEISAMFIQPDDKIILSGSKQVPGTGYDFMALRLDTAGSLDLSFNGNGYAIGNIISGNINEYGAGLCVFPDGRILISGTVELSSAINEDGGLLMLKPVLNTTSISEASAGGILSVSPNPGRDLFRVEIAQSGLYRVWNSTGSLQQSLSLIAGTQMLDASTWAPGLYILQDVNSGQTRTLVRY